MYRLLTLMVCLSLNACATYQSTSIRESSHDEKLTDLINDTKSLRSDSINRL
jgi:hypothetical protein